MPNDSLVFRIKYAYAQFNLDDWMARGSWVRMGIQQTPWVDFEEGIYRYRFQGTVFVERVPLPTVMSSSDAGISFHYNFASNYGDVHFGVYNGENYQRTETNDQKGFEFRGTLGRFARGKPIFEASARISSITTTLRERRRAKRVMGNVTYEHSTSTPASITSTPTIRRCRRPPTSGNGYSIWATPRSPFENGSSWEALIRYDHWTPNTADDARSGSDLTGSGTTRLSDQHQNRTIVGIAYWFPHQGNVSAAILVDYDAQNFDNITAPEAKTVSIHGLLNF